MLQNLYFQIPQALANKLNILSHSTVRIKQVKSAIKVAFSIRLQPLKPLVSTEVVCIYCVCGVVDEEYFMCSKLLSVMSIGFSD